MIFDPIITGSLLILAAGGPVDGLCDMSRQTQINVRPISASIKYDYTQNLEEIQRYGTDTINPYEFHAVTKTQGFASGVISVTQSIKLGNRSIPRYGTACVWYEEVNIDIEIEPEIVIAREVYEDKCRHKAVLAHELKHVKADRDIVNNFAQNIGSKIYAGLSDRGFNSGAVRVENVQNVAERMQKIVGQIVDFETKKMEIARTEAQAAIDSRTEYDRVSEQSRTCK